jgi:hypothetical protein
METETQKKTNHPNNSEAVEASIQKFLSAKTRIGAASGFHQVSFRDKIRLLLQPFASPSSGICFYWISEGYGEN